jgi:hypothetical protein
VALLSVMDVIEEAYERIQHDPRAGYDYRTARRSIDIMMSDWANRGLNLWTVEERVYPLIAGQASVALDADIFDVMDAVIRDPTATPPLDIGLDRMSQTDYLSLPYKDMPGMPSRYMVTRSTPPMTATLWQVTDRPREFVVNALRIIPSLSGYAGPFAIPERFQNALISGLAYHLAMKKNPDRVQQMMALYERDFEIAAGEDRDRSSFFFVPEVTL